jgi:hypothetical protein
VAIRFGRATARGVELFYPACSDSLIAGGGGGYDAGVQPPPPGFPPQWGSSPDEPRDYPELGSGVQPSPEGYGQPGPGGYGAAPNLGYPQPGYGPPAWGGQGTQPVSPASQQSISWITFAGVGLLALLGAILTLTLWLNMSSAADRATDMCKRFAGEFSDLCEQQIESTVPSVPTALATCLFLIMAAGLVATAGAVMLFLKKQAGQFLILGGGIVMLVLAIGCEARYGATGRLTYDLVGGFVIAATGGLMLIPAFRMTMGLPPNPTGAPPPGGPPERGQWQYGQPPPPQQSPPGAGGYPPPHW